MEKINMKQVDIMIIVAILPIPATNAGSIATTSDGETISYVENTTKRGRINIPIITYTTYDNFDSKLYTLKDDSISPNNKWECLWNGYGSSGTKKDTSGKNVFFMYLSTSRTIDEASSNLIISTRTFSNFEFTIDTKNRQTTKTEQSS